jgi:hypothetical protein
MPLVSSLGYVREGDTVCGKIRSGHEQKDLIAVVGYTVQCAGIPKLPNVAGIRSGYGRDTGTEDNKQYCKCPKGGSGGGWDAS